MVVGTARYISYDPIGNLKIKVKLKRITSTSFLAETFANPTTSGQDIELATKQEEAGTTEELVLSWQQKVLSQREIEQYGDDLSCTSVREKNYHEMIIKMKEKNEFKTTRIFTYVNEDPFVCLSNKENRPLTTHKNRSLTYLEHKVSQARPAGTRKQQYTALQEPVYVPTSGTARTSNHVQLHASQTMYIMADIGRARGLPKIEDEQALCCVTVDTNHMVTVTPNFTTSPITLDNSDGDVWEYTLEHITPQISEKEEYREKEVMEDLFSRHASMLHSMVGVVFSEPPDEGATRVHVFGQIARALNFSSENLFVNYSFDLPVGWCVEHEVEMRGMTQRSKIRETKQGQIAHFNHPFEMTLFNSTKSEEDMGNRPRLFVEVRSVDSWQRVRLEGYGYVTLRTTPGCHTYKIDTWRPEGPNNNTKLRRFFIGGTPELSDVRYVHIPSNYSSHPDQKMLLGKFGFKTISSGSVEIKINTVHQVMPSFVQDDQKYKRIALKDKYGRPGVQLALLEAIEHFAKARKRLETMRSTLEPSLARLARNVTTEQSIINKWTNLTLAKED